MGPPQHSPSTNRDGWHVLALTLLGIGIILRFTRIDFQSFWMDEALSILFAQPRFPSPFFENLTFGVHPPLYYLILHFWMDRFGDSDAVIRLLSALCSGLFVLLLYRLGTVLLGARTALLAATICAFSSFQIWYAQEARSYALVMLLALLCMWCVVRAIEAPRTSNASLLGATIALLFLTHYVALLFIITLMSSYALSIVLRYRRPSAAPQREPHQRDLKLAVRGFLISCLVALLGVSWWIPNFPKQHGAFTPWIARPSVGELLTLPLELLSLHLSFSLRAFFTALLIATPLAILLTQRTSGTLLPDTAHFPEGGAHVRLWLMSLALVPPLVAWTLSQWTTPIFLPRTLSMSAPALYLLIADLMQSLRSSSWRALVLSVVLALGGVLLPQQFTAIRKQDWRGAARFVEVRHREGDAFVFEAPGVETVFGHYFDRSRFEIQRLADPLAADRVWTIIGMSPLTKKQVDGHMRRVGYKSMKWRGFVGVEVSLFSKIASDLARPAVLSSPQSPG